MHLHLHLKESFLDYGPPHAFWCFAFERYNGILGSYHTNKRSVESQFMKIFLTNQAIHSLLVSNNHPVKTFFPIAMKNRNEENECMNVTDICVNSTQAIDIITFSTKPLGDIDSFACNVLINPMPPFFDTVFTPSQFQQLKSAIAQLYPNKSIVHLSHSYQCFGRVRIGEFVIGSTLPGGNCKNSSTSRLW